MQSEVNFITLNPNFMFAQGVSVKPGDFITLVSGEKNDPVWFAVVVDAPDSNHWFRVCWYSKRVRRGNHGETILDVWQRGSEDQRVSKSSVMAVVPFSSWRYVGASIAIQSADFRSFRSSAWKTQETLTALDRPALLPEPIAPVVASAPSLSEQAEHFAHNYEILKPGLDMVRDFSSNHEYSFFMIKQIKAGRDELPATVLKALEAVESTLLMNILNCEHALPVVVHIYIQECLNFVYVRYLESPAVSGVSRAFAMRRYPTSFLVEDNQLTNDVISTTTIRPRRFRAAQDKATLENKFHKLITSCAEELFVGSFSELVLGDSLNDTKLALCHKGECELPSFIRGILVVILQFSTFFDHLNFVRLG